MKLSSLLTRKTLRATAARRSLGVPDEMDYEEMSEPNMKLSRALLIVLVLHVVAISGMVAFNVIKSRQAPILPAAVPKAVVQTSVPRSTAPTATTSAPAVKPRDEMATTKPVVKEERKAIPVKPIAENSPKAESKKTYVVAKGDTPLSIAKKFKVPFDDLLATNKIDDPHKLQIGQKLVIPVKKTKPKKSE